MTIGLHSTRKVFRSMLVILFTTALFIGAAGCSNATSSGPDDLVTEIQISDYADAYLDTYINLIDQNFREPYRQYFPFYAQYPYHVRCTISTERGVAIEFIPSVNPAKEAVIATTAVEEAIFEDTNLGILNLEYQVTGGTVILWKGVADSPMFTIGGKHSTISSLRAITN